MRDYGPAYPPWFFIPPRPPRRRRRHGTPVSEAASIDDMIAEHKKWTAYLEELKAKEKKPEEKPKGFVKFQQVMGHWGYLCLVGFPVGLVTLGAFWLTLMSVTKAIEALAK